MKKVFASALVVGCVVCSAVSAQACHYYEATQVNEYAFEWTDSDNILHSYVLYTFDNPTTTSSPGLIEDKYWTATQAWVSSYMPDYYLATITSQEESDALAGSGLFAGLGIEIWLGAQRAAAGSSTWVWENSEGTWTQNSGGSFEPWNGGEPNNLNELYLGMYTNSMLWNDEGAAGNIYGFLVEKTSPVPEPATMLLFGTGLMGLAAVGRKRMK